MHIVCLYLYESVVVTNVREPLIYDDAKTHQDLVDQSHRVGERGRLGRVLAAAVLAEVVRGRHHFKIKTFFKLLIELLLCARAVPAAQRHKA